MADLVKMWQGEYLFGLGYPTVIVTSQDREGNEFPCEFFLWVQELPTFRIRSMQQTITATAHPQSVDAAFEMSQEEGEQAAFGFAQGNLRQWQFEAYEKHQYDPALKPPDLRPADDWKRALYRLRLQGRLDQTFTMSVANRTNSMVLRAFMMFLTKVSPVRKGPINPYIEKD